MWMARAMVAGQERVFLEPASAEAVSELKRAALPAADLEPYQSLFDESSTQATVPYDAMLSRLEEQQALEAKDIVEVALVHMPVYRFKYAYKEERYTAVVDAASGEVFANIYPAKWEVPYRSIAIAAFVGYFVVSLIPLFFFLSGGLIELGTGMLIYALAAAGLAVPIFFAALGISAKV
jgi:hypothetical protein